MGKVVQFSDDYKAYLSSSKVVQDKIASGVGYERSVLVGTKTAPMAAFVEQYLILDHIFDNSCLNQSYSIRGKVAQGKKEESRKILEAAKVSFASNNNSE